MPHLRITLKDRKSQDYIEEASDFLALDALRQEFGDKWTDAMQRLWEETKSERKEFLKCAGTNG